MTTAFVGLLVGVLVISFIGIMSARAARKNENARRSQKAAFAGQARTTDRAASGPSSEPDRNKSSNEGISALAGGNGQFRQ